METVQRSRRQRHCRTEMALGRLRSVKISGTGQCKWSCVRMQTSCSCHNARHAAAAATAAAAGALQTDRETERERERERRLVSYQAVYQTDRRRRKPLLRGISK